MWYKITQKSYIINHNKQESVQMNMDERLLWRVLKPKDENYNVEDVGMNCSHQTFCYDLGNLRKVTCSIPQAQIDTVPINNNIFLKLSNACIMEGS